MSSPTLSKKLRTENRKLHSSIAVVLFVVFITVAISVLFLAIRGLFKSKSNNSETPSTISKEDSSSQETIVKDESKTTAYKVESGDTLYAIGIKFKVDWKEIAKLNDIEPPYSLSTGQELKIPENTTSNKNINKEE